MRLELRGVTAGYGGVTVLRNIDLVVPAGTVVALLGANGAGKTTTLRVASQLVRPRAGSLVLDGEDVTSASSVDIAARGVCHVTEGRCVFPGLSVRENLSLFSEPGDETAGTERAIHAFPKLGQRLNQIAGTMSGGEQQMLAVSRAYARQASLVLLDEMSMGLAPMIIDEIMDFLRVLVRRGVSLLLVEQYVAKALEIADKVYVIDRGRIVFAGEPGEVTDATLLSKYLGAESVEVAQRANEALARKVL
jgi:branched-chain amino acid transport system ATP-binding protein